MLGLSSVIACTTRNLFALTPLIPLFQACAGFAIRSPACEGVKTQNRVHGPDSDLYTLRFGIVPVSGNFFTYHSDPGDRDTI
jgi:hypothetical protein